MRHDWFNRKVVRILYVIFSVTLLIFATEIYLLLQDIIKKSDEINHHNQKRAYLLDTYNAFSQVETSTRGFLLLKDPLFLLSRSDGIKDLTVSGTRLLTSIHEDDTIRADYNALLQKFHKRINHLDEALAVSDSEVRKRIIESSALTLEEARIDVTELLKNETKEIEELTTNLNASIYKAPGSVLLMAVIFIVFLLVSYISLDRQLAESKQLQNRLTESNQSLSSSEDLLKSILNANPDGLVAYEAVRDAENRINDFKVIFAAGKIKAARNMEPHTLIDKLATEIYPNLKTSGFFEKMVEITETGISQSLQVNYPDDGIVAGWYEVRMVKYRNGFILEGRDINHIKKTEQELKSTIEDLHKTNEQLKQFTFIASHDLQEPLRKIQVFANKILHEQKLSEKHKADVDKMKEAANRLSALIQGIAGFSRLQVDDTKFEFVDLNLLMHQTLSDLELVIKEKDAEIIIDQLPSIYCDPLQVGQLFSQLLSNSLKFNRKRPHIEIHSSIVSDQASKIANKNVSMCRLTFTDNGIGFSPQYSHKLFNLFQRLHKEPEFPGTGIGLVICKKIVENHKGSITAYGSEGAGATFDVYLPVLQ